MKDLTFLPESSLTEEEIIKEANRCLSCLNPQCVKGCPLPNKIPDFIKQVKQGDFDSAYKILKEETILPEICGTICPHEKQCQGKCILGIKGTPVKIGAIEAFTAKKIRESQSEYKQNITSNKYNIACIGSGPASLALALLLSENGYNITIYEKEEYFGGVLKWGIPSYRLNPKILEDKIELLRKRGVRFINKCEINDLSKLKKEYDAIFIGIGATIPNRSKLEGEDLRGVYFADDFLKSVNLAPLDKQGNRSFEACGRNVVVVGGGNVAMDVARDAIRLKQVESVTILYRRSENEMPACKQEIDEAKAEGIRLLTLTNPVRYLGKDGILEQVECAIMELGQPDASGRRRPIESDKEHVFIKADTAILALGFNNDKTMSEQNIIEADKWGCFIVDEKRMTSSEGVYAGGDAVNGADTVVKAMKDGIIAAKAIMEKLR